MNRTRKVSVDEAGFTRCLPDASYRATLELTRSEKQNPEAFRLPVAVMSYLKIAGPLRCICSNPA